MKALFVAIFSLVLVNAAAAGTVTGTVRDLKGGLLPTQGFVVQAIVGGAVLAEGTLVPGTIADYTITIDNNDLNQEDVRVQLFYQAIGRQSVTLNGIAGNVNHNISIVMPEASCVYKPQCCVHKPQCRLLRRYGR